MKIEILAELIHNINKRRIQFRKFAPEQIWLEDYFYFYANQLDRLLMED